MHQKYEKKWNLLGGLYKNRVKEEQLFWNSHSCERQKFHNTPGLSISAGKWETQNTVLLEIWNYTIEILPKPHYWESYIIY